MAYVGTGGTFVADMERLYNISGQGSRDKARDICNQLNNRIRPGSNHGVIAYEGHMIYWLKLSDGNYELTKMT